MWLGNISSHIVCQLREKLKYSKYVHNMSKYVCNMSKYMHNIAKFVDETKAVLKGNV